MPNELGHDMNAQTHPCDLCARGLRWEGISLRATFYNFPILLSVCCFMCRIGQQTECNGINYYMYVTAVRGFAASCRQHHRAAATIMSRCTMSRSLRVSVYTQKNVHYQYHYQIFKLDIWCGINWVSKL